MSLCLRDVILSFSYSRSKFGINIFICCPSSLNITASFNEYCKKPSQCKTKLYHSVFYFNCIRIFERLAYIRIYHFYNIFFYLLCKYTLRQKNVRDRERNIRKGPKNLFEIEKFEIKR